MTSLQNSGSSRRHRTRLCLVAQATKSQGDIVTASCSPDARDSTCLAELTLPIHWWPEASQPRATSSTGSTHHSSPTSTGHNGVLPLGDGESQFTTHPSNLNVPKTAHVSKDNIFSSAAPVKPTKIPIQVNWLFSIRSNYPCNWGSSSVDKYIYTHRLVFPKNLQPFFIPSN